jgi:hypothetical protein
MYVYVQLHTVSLCCMSVSMTLRPPLGKIPDEARPESREQPHLAAVAAQLRSSRHFSFIAIGLLSSHSTGQFIIGFLSVPSSVGSHCLAPRG